MNTRKHPRTLNEAFGPYTSSRIDDDLPMDWQDKVVVGGCFVTLIICGALMLWGIVV